MPKAKLIAIDPRQLSEMAWNRDSRRNVLGVIKKDTLEAFILEFVGACEAVGVSCTPFVKRLAYIRENRLELFNETLQQEVDGLSKRPVGILGLFFDEASVYQADGTKIPDPEHLVLHIYYTIKKKSLTHFRKFLLDHILEIQEPIIQET